MPSQTKILSVYWIHNTPIGYRYETAKFRMLAVNDDCCRENLCLMADTSISGARVSASNETVIHSYEDRVAKLERDSAVLGEKLINQAEPKGTFEET